MLPFDADALFAAFAHYHAIYWPLQWLALAGGAATIGLATAHAPHGTRTILLLLSSAWLWVGVAWHVATFAGINFAAPLYGALFMVEGGLLAWAAMRGRVALRFRHCPRHWVGLGLAVAALVGYPAIDRLSGVSWVAVRLPGAAPCPTALLTLGVLLLAQRRPPAALMILPVLWTCVAGATGWVLGIGQDQLLILAGAVALVVAVWPEPRAAL